MLTFNKTVQKGAYNKDKRQTIQRESEKTNKHNHVFLTISSQHGAQNSAETQT